MKFINPWIFYPVMMILVIIISNSAYGQDFNDAEIADIAVTANQIDIRYAKAALEHSETEAVREFAQTTLSPRLIVISSGINFICLISTT